jgi:prevent-host-death family protein
MKRWTAHDAGARFSELLRAAEKRPQRITVRGKPVAVLLSDREYRRLSGESERPKRTFAEWWKSAPRVPEFKLPRRV